MTARLTKRVRGYAHRPPKPSSQARALAGSDVTSTWQLEHTANLFFYTSYNRRIVADQTHSSPSFSLSLLSASTIGTCENPHFAPFSLAMAYCEQLSTSCSNSRGGGTPACLAQTEQLSQLVEPPGSPAPKCSAKPSAIH